QHLRVVDGERFCLGRAQLEALLPRRLQALRRELAAAIVSVDRALAALGAAPPTPDGAGNGDPARTYAMAERYVAEGWDGTCDITAREAVPWMLEYGWNTNAGDRVTAVS